jgi:protein ImuA
MLSPARTPAPGTANSMPAESPLKALGGLAARRRLHALHPARPGQETAAAGFGLALVQALERLEAERQGMTLRRPVLWVLPRATARECGRPYGPGLIDLGLSPDRLIVIAVDKAMDAFAAAEMGLEERGLAGVLVDLPARLPADLLRLGKRLSLRAEAQATPCLLLHATAEPIEAPIASRWTVASRPVARSLAPDFTTAFELTLTKNRSGRLGRFAVAWQSSGSSHHAFSFVPLRPAVSRHLVPDLADGPAGARRGPVGGEVRPFQPIAA